MRQRRRASAIITKKQLHKLLDLRPGMFIAGIRITDFGADNVLEILIKGNDLPFCPEGAEVEQRALEEFQNCL